MEESAEVGAALRAGVRKKKRGRAAHDAERSVDVDGRMEAVEAMEEECVEHMWRWRKFTGRRISSHFCSSVRGPARHSPNFRHPRGCLRSSGVTPGRFTLHSAGPLTPR